MAQETVLVPDIGGSEAAEVVEILVSVGDMVDVDQGLLVLESDKASMEIPSTVAGKVVEVLAKEGDELGEGASVAVIEVSASEESEDSSSDSDSSPDADADTVKSAGSSDERDDDTEQDAEDEEESSEDQGSEDEDKQDKQNKSESGGAAASKKQIEVPVPDIGTDEAVDLVEISVAVGDSVAEGDTLVVLESDKASMEVPSPSAGVVKELHVKEEQQVREGDKLLTLESEEAGEAGESEGSKDDGASSSDDKNSSKESGASGTRTHDAKKSGKISGESEKAARSEGGQSASQESAAKDSESKGVYAGPAVRRLAREFGVPLKEVTSSGPRGRILKEDLHSYVQRALSEPKGASPGGGIPAIPEQDFSAHGPVEVVERSKIDKVTAANMQRSWLNVPHVTQFDDADITELEAFRQELKAEAEKRGTRLTPVPFLLKACAVALKKHEKINSSLSDGGTTLTFKRYVNIGMAVDTPAGLVVPVLKNVDQKSLWELAEEVLELAGKARDRKLKPAEMQGAGFTISSLGPIGGRGFTPIVNSPEVAILGVSRSETRPVWNGKEFAPRLQLPLALSYDHRVVNGGDAGRFLTELCELLGDIRKLLL